ncbi:MAG: hypothetical protein N3A63_05385 [Bacteroidetes bacterium]|nr:hypothetical protein [Bacteroidota bacterium]
MDVQTEVRETKMSWNERVFKRCPLCGKEWKTSDDFLKDPDLQVNGYQGNLHRLFMGIERGGLVLFTHNAENCGTTLAFTADNFRLQSKRPHSFR